MAAEPPLTALIVDDEPLAIERLEMMAADIAELSIVGTASDGDAALAMIGTNMPDLILLDIAMPGLDGISLARMLENRRPRPLVIFVTAFDHYAIDAFEAAAIDYLLKPVTTERLTRAIRRARDIRPARPSGGYIEELWVPFRSDMIRIDVEAIDWIEAERDYMRLHVASRSHLLHMTIAELERRLDPRCFIRIHRSAIVRRDFIARFRRDRGGNWIACMADGSEQKVGRTYIAAARQLVAGDPL
jgi:two-component system response regulator AlgR